MNQSLSILLNLCGDRNKASSRVRGYWISEELQKIGYKVTHNVVSSRIGYLQLAARILRHDVVIFQKTYSRYDPVLMRMAQFLGKSCFFDIDDAPSRIQNTTASRNASRMMRSSNGVFAGCQELVALAKNEQPLTYLIPSGIRLKNYPIIENHTQNLDAPICLGWIGNGAHYVEDLTTLLYEPLQRLASRHPLKFRIVGSCGVPKLMDVFGSIQGLEIELIEQIEWSSPQAVTQAIAPFDIGLYPLISSPFNNYKCGFKALEYMASGIPVVASDVPGNRDIIKNGSNGYLVQTTNDWVGKIELLVNDIDLRKRIGLAGRNHVENEYCTSNIASNIASIISNAKH